MEGTQSAGNERSGETKCDQRPAWMLEFIEATKGVEYGKISLHMVGGIAERVTIESSRKLRRNAA